MRDALDSLSHFLPDTLIDGVHVSNQLKLQGVRQGDPLMKMALKAFP